MLTGKTIVLGVTGSIAAYKTANLASMLIKLGADVEVIMTQNAQHFITPMTFETLTGHKCITDTFDRQHTYDVKHVSLAKRADLFMVAPCTANVIGKLAAGVCDDMLTTTLFATRAPRLLAPAMNTGMWDNPLLQDNLRRLEHYGYQVVTPDTGRLACGDVGRGKMPAEDVLVEHILLQVAREKDFRGRRVLISAGPTREAIDPVRYITNHSSGKMGYALAKMAALRGAQVTLVSGPVSLKPFAGIDVVGVTSARQMYDAVTKHSAEADVVIMCAAVADYTPATVADQKLKKHDADMSIVLTRTSDILSYLGQHKRPGQIVVGFSMETEQLMAHSQEKLVAKNADLICANSIATGQTGFGVDTNRVTLIARDGATELPLCSKEETADLILNNISQRFNQ